MKNKWTQKQYGTGWQCRSFSIEPLNDEWCLKCNGRFVASFKTAGSCKRVGQCILREFSRMDETLHYTPRDE